MILTIREYLWIALASIYTIFAFYMMFSKKEDKHRLTFGLLIISIAVWIFSVAMLMLANSVTLVALWAKMVFVAASSIIFTFVWFSYKFIEKNRKTKIEKILLLSIYLIASALIIFTNLILTDFNPLGNTLVEKAPVGKQFPVYVVFYLLNIYFCIRNFLKGYQSSVGIVRSQILYITYSTILLFLLTVSATLILPVFKINDFVWLGPYTTLVFIGGISYTILKYRLFDIEVVIKRTSVYLVIVAVITGLYAFIVLVPYSIFGKPGSNSSLIVLIIATFIITITIQPLRNWLDSVTDKIFFQKKYNYEKILEKISKQLNSIVKLEDAYEAVMEPFNNDMHLKGVALYMRQKAGDENYVCQTREGLMAKALPDKVDDNNPLVSYLNQIQTYLEPGEFKYKFGHLYVDGDVKDVEKSWIQYEMDNTFQAGLFMPLLLKENMIGFIVLGEKMSGDQFTQRDLSLIETIASQLVTAMDNIRLYDQMLNNERLTIIGTMSASIAHEIRNPLASIKTFIQMLKDKHDKPEFMEKFDQIVPAEIERIAGITADLLNFSKPSSPSLQEVNIANIIERVAALLAAQLRKRQIKLEKDLNEELTIQADSQQLFQVFLNIMLNAMQASPKETSIKVSTQVKTINHPYDDFTESVVYVDFEDQGEGIKKKDLENIFQPFVTSKTEGTGLGLATCKRIIDAHRGNIYVESVLGKGTKMSVVLPMELTQEVIEQYS